MLNGLIHYLPALEKSKTYYDSCFSDHLIPPPIKSYPLLNQESRLITLDLGYNILYAELYLLVLAVIGIIFIKSSRHSFPA